MENGIAQPVLRCPGVRMQTQGSGDLAHQGDYIYINWGQPLVDTTESLASRYPIVYDAKLSNHKGKGINILLLDGSVIWDEGAHWLYLFATKHKDIPLPK